MLSRNGVGAGSRPAPRVYRSYQSEDRYSPLGEVAEQSSLLEFMRTALSSARFHRHFNTQAGHLADACCKPATLSLGLIKELMRIAGKSHFECMVSLGCGKPISSLGERIRQLKDPHQEGLIRERRRTQKNRKLFPQPRSWKVLLWIQYHSHKGLIPAAEKTSQRRIGRRASIRIVAHRSQAVYAPNLE